MMRTTQDIFRNTIVLNVGGEAFATCPSTLEKCARAEEIIESSQMDGCFLDRDPSVFRKTLKLLRCYPSTRNAWTDDDVLEELAWLQHECFSVDIPAWIVNAEKLPSTIRHTLDPEQTRKMGATHTLIRDEVVTFLLDQSILGDEDFPPCRVVGDEAWAPHRWVNKHTWLMALKRVAFRMYFLSECFALRVSSI